MFMRCFGPIHILWPSGPVYVCTLELSLTHRYWALGLRPFDYTERTNAPMNVQRVKTSGPKGFKVPQRVMV